MTMVQFVMCDGPGCIAATRLNDAQGEGWSAVYGSYHLNATLDYCPKHKEG